MHEPVSGGTRTTIRKRRRVRAVAILPTLITLGNAVCGFLALTQVARGLDAGPSRDAHFHTAAFLILLAMIFDALDGKVARMTKTASSFGTQLDSLCDFVTFGITPAFLTWGLWSSTGDVLVARMILGVCLFYACCAGVRLARFNVETGVEEKFHHEFAGLPSPAAAGVVASMVLPWNAIPEDPALLAAAVRVLKAGLPVTLFLLGVLMVSRVPYPHMVNRLFRGVRPFVTLIELAIVALLAVVFHEFALFLGFFFYAASGPLWWVRRRLSRKGLPPPEPAARAPGGPSDDALF